MYWQRDRHIYLWNRTESSEISQPVYGELIFSKCAKAINGKRTAFARNGTGINGYPETKELIWNFILHYIQKAASA